MKDKHKKAYMECARTFAKLSYAERAKVGAVAVTPQDVMLYSYNGTASGDDNTCEYASWEFDGFEHHSKLITKSTVLHAERNIIAKAAREGISLKGSTLFITLSCCLECALMIYQAGIVKVVYDVEYRCRKGIEYLLEHGVEVEQFK